MSAYNSIVILQTFSEWEHNGNHMVRVPRRKVYRVAEVSAPPKFEWYKKYELYNLEHYLWVCFKNSKVYEAAQAAFNQAEYLHNEIGYVEYGIQFVTAEYVFPGD